MIARFAGATAVACVALVLAGCDTLALIFGFPEPTITTRTALPIELAYRQGKDGLVILTGRVDGKVDVDFILDSGAPVTVLIANERTAALGIDTSNARRLGPDNDPASPTGVVRNGLTLEFGSVALAGLSAVVLPEATLACPERMREVGFEGVIGADLFRRFVIEVDTSSKRIRLHEPSRWSVPTGAVAVPVRLDGGHVYVEATLALPSGESITMPMHLDTGMTTALSLVADSHPALAMPAQGEVTRTCFVSGRREVRTGPPISVRLGEATFASVPTRFTTKNDAPAVQQRGAVGSGMLSTRRYAIDYPGKRLVLM